jgi:two-component system cell cycle response regulator
MRIVLVEPSRTVQRIVTSTVGPWGHEVCAFMDGRAALAFLRADKSVRALITSTELASISGMRLVNEARMLADAQRPLYIILMSSSGERSKMVEALDNGADDFISKPPAPEELRARLRAADRITAMQAELIVLATTDCLTGLLNRRAFVEAAQEMLQRTSAGHPLSVLICDVDRFKAINDRYGHDVGDHVLRKIGDELRSLAVPGRLGGEEFALLVEGRLGDAIDLAERVREAVSELTIRADGETIVVTCSVGVAEWECGDSIDTLLRRADVALYEAKRSGRNRVVAADSFPLGDGHDQWRGVARLATRKRVTPASGN